ncbi:hypothetical protein Taro_025332 [Colocasia esculenta]|uniref:Uncharacterized protein n=1 Tax=Colocasia esculenta TaxID=4460 RepID=A0A843VG88_COLES|nr:hypothetical protein [Colocasia esculenta]
MPSCFGFASPRPRRSSPPSPQLPTATHPPSEDGDGANPDAATPRSGRSAAASASPTTFNLLAREFTLAIQSRSYAEIWSKIHTFTSSSSAVPGDPASGEQEEDRLGRPEGEDGGAAPSSSSAHLIGEVLRPDRGSVDEALRGARPGRLSRLVSDYFDSSEHTSRLCLRLHRCVDRARSIYSPLLELLEVLPTPVATAATTPASSPLSSSSLSQNHHHHPQAQHRLHRHHLSQTQCERAFDTFQEFGAHDNPFPAPGSAEDGASFQEMRCCFAELKQQLDHRLRQVRARARLLHRTAAGSALCLVGAVVGITVSGLLLAVHALPALAAAPLLGFLRLPLAHPLAAKKRRLREHIAQLDAAARGTYVLNNDLDTIERLVARLHATVESDRVLVSLALSRGRGDHHPLEQVVGQLRRNRRGLLEQLHDLEEHVCLCFAAINRARSLLLQHIHSHYHHPHYHSEDRRTPTTSASATREEGEEEEEEGQDLEICIAHKEKRKSGVTDQQGDPHRELLRAGSRPPPGLSLPPLVAWRVLVTNQAAAAWHWPPSYGSAAPSTHHRKNTRKDDSFFPLLLLFFQQTLRSRQITTPAALPAADVRPSVRPSFYKKDRYLRSLAVVVVRGVGVVARVWKLRL